MGKVYNSSSGNLNLLEKISQIKENVKVLTTSLETIKRLIRNVRIIYPDGTIPGEWKELGTECVLDLPYGNSLIFGNYALFFLMKDIE